MQMETHYAASSGVVVLSGKRLSTPAAGLEKITVETDPKRHWVDHAAAGQLSDDHAAALAAWQPGDDPLPEPDWSLAVRDKTDCPASIAGAVDGRFAADIDAGPVIISDVPPWSMIRITGPVSRTVTCEDGVAVCSLPIVAPGEYRVTITSARHLPWEIIINAA